MEDATLPSMGRGGSGPKASAEVKNAHWPPKKNDPVHSHEPPENCCCCPQKVVEEDPRMVRVKSMQNIHVSQKVIDAQPKPEDGAPDAGETKEEGPPNGGGGKESPPRAENASDEPAPEAPKRMDDDFDDDLSRYPEPEIVIDEVSFPEAVERKDAPAIGIMGFLCCGGNSGFKRVGSGGAPADMP